MTGPIFPDTRRATSPNKLALAERMRLLQAVPLFDGAAKRHVRHVARLARLERFEADQDVLTEGQPSTAAFVIIGGEAVVRRKGRKIADVGQGDIVGELGLLLDRPRNASVRTLTPLDCLALDRSTLKATVEEFPKFGWHLLQTVAARLAT